MFASPRMHLRASAFTAQASVTRLQAVGFAILVAGTVVYGHGDQMEEKEEEESRQRLKIPKKVGPAFRQSMTIRALPLHTITHHRWRRAGVLALAAARLQQAGEDHRTRSGHHHEDA
jgi:hypothetical protein